MSQTKFITVDGRKVPLTPHTAGTPKAEDKIAAYLEELGWTEVPLTQQGVAAAVVDAEEWSGYAPVMSPSGKVYAYDNDQWDPVHNDLMVSLKGAGLLDPVPEEETLRLNRVGCNVNLSSFLRQGWVRLASPTAFHVYSLNPSTLKHLDRLIALLPRGGADPTISLGVIDPHYENSFAYSEWAEAGGLGRAIQEQRRLPESMRKADKPQKWVTVNGKKIPIGPKAAPAGTSVAGANGPKGPPPTALPPTAPVSVPPRKLVGGKWVMAEKAKPGEQPTPTPAVTKLKNPKPLREIDGVTVRLRGMYASYTTPYLQTLYQGAVARKEIDPQKYSIRQWLNLHGALDSPVNGVPKDDTVKFVSLDGTLLKRSGDKPLGFFTGPGGKKIPITPNAAAKPAKLKEKPVSQTIDMPTSDISGELGTSQDMEVEVTRLYGLLDDPNVEPAVLKNLVCHKIAERLDPADPDIIAWVKSPLGKEIKEFFDHTPLDEDPVYAAVNMWVCEWAYSTNKTPRSVMTQIAITREFGLKNPEMAYMNPAILRASVKRLDAGNGAVGRAVQKFVRAQYEETQAWFAQQGISEVTAYRGVCMNPTSAEKKNWDKEEKLPYTLQPLSSFSADPITAASFAAHGGMGNYPGGGQKEIRYRQLLAAKIPVARIFSTPLTGVGCKKEAELTVLASDSPAKLPTLRYTSPTFNVPAFLDTETRKSIPGGTQSSILQALSGIK
jgi:hypothetical protein